MQRKASRPMVCGGVAVLGEQQALEGRAAGESAETAAATPSLISSVMRISLVLDHTLYFTPVRAGRDAENGPEQVRL